MCKKVILLVLVLSFCLTSSLPAYTIIFVSDNKNTGNTDPVTGGPRDQVWIDLLEGAGYTVDLSFANQEGRSLNQTKIDALDAADLIIVSRNTNSGDYDNGSAVDDWNSITTPIILHAAHIYRSSRWRWLDSTNVDGTTGNLLAVLPEHPIFDGVTLDASNEVGIVTDNTNVGNTTDPGNGTMIATRSDNNGAWIVEWEEGVEYYSGSGQTAGSARMYFPIGHGGDNRDGQYNLTAEGETLFLNAVSYMIQAGIHLTAYKPDPADGATGVVFPLLQWTKGSTAGFHDVYFGTDPTPGAAEYAGRLPLPQTMHFVGTLAPGTTYYWRVDEVEADGTTIHTGDVWSFSTPPLTAHNPDPPDGARYVGTDTDLGWTAGFDAVTHDVYFGTDETAVTDGTGGTFKGNQPAMTYDPGTLAKDTTYYWRIDEVLADGTTKNTGEVWRFTTIPEIVITNPDLVGWWTLDEGIGTTALDWSGHDNHGILMGSPEWWPDGYDGGALHFDGGDYVAIQNLNYNRTDYAGVTTCAWVRTSSASTQYIISYDRNEYWRLEINGSGGGPGQVGWDVLTSTGQVDYGSNRRVDDGEWHHVAGVFNNGTLTIYIDGMPEPSATGGSTFGTGNTRYGFIGANSEASSFDGSRGGGSPIAGELDDVRVYSKALTQAEIKEAMRGNPLLAWNANPANRSTPDIEHATPLTWSPGDNAAKHDVYFGTDMDAVIDADSSDTTGVYRGRQDPNTYTPGGVELGGSYYWRIDEFNTDATISEGRTWTFSVAEYLIVDDFEPYDDYCNRIFYTWLDGWGHNGDVGCGVPPFGGNGSGSTVGYLSEPYAEQTIVHSGDQSMPMEYLNDGSTGKALYSETERAFDAPQDWTRRGVKALTLWFHGVPGSVGSFSYDPATGIYTLTGAGTDIWNVPDFSGAGAGNYHDEFHYAYKQLSGLGSIQVNVRSLSDAHEWVKGGLMIRETLDANSVYTSALITPQHGVRFQIRTTTGGETTRTFDDTVAAPQWLRLEREAGDTYTISYSPDGSAGSWTPVGDPVTVGMNVNVYIGLALTSHTAGVMATAELSDITTTGTVTGQWQSQDIGIASNDAERLYVALEDSTGTVKDVPHADPNAVQLDSWQEWNIPLDDFAPVDLTKIKKIHVGVGNRNVPTAGGGGMLYIDDIRLYPPRCMPDLVKPAADFSNNCVVDYPDLEIMSNNWLVSNYDVTPDGSNLGAGLIAHYKLDGNLNDIVGGNNGTKMGSGAATYQTSMDGQALELDGVDDYVDTDVNATDLGIDANSPKSVTAWVYTRGFNGGGIFDMGSNQDGRNFSLRTLGTDNVWRAQRWGYPTYDFDFEYDSLDKWVHFALVYGGAAAGDESWAYADGHLVGSQVAAMDTDGAGRTFQIGVWSGNYFDGLIDNLRVYNRALSQAEAASLAGRTAPFTQLMYPLIDPMDPDSGMVDMNADGTINLKDCALLFDAWLDEELWP